MCQDANVEMLEKKFLNFTIIGFNDILQNYG